MAFSYNRPAGALFPDDLVAEEASIDNEHGEAWESDTEGDGVERWVFPRVANPLGMCEAKGKAHTDMHHETTKCDDFTIDPGVAYLSRAGVGDYDTDVETLVGLMEAPRTIVGAVLLLGDPGTGKTALAEAAAVRAEADVTTVVCTPDHTKDSLFLRFVGEGRGDLGKDGNPTPYKLGPIPYAAKHGHWLYLDEVMLLLDGVKPLLYPLADGRAFLPEGDVDGSPLEIHPNFRMILSANPQVRGASLPEPLASRCAGATFTIETDAALLRALDIDENLVLAWEALGGSELWQPQIREMRVADYWLAANPALALSAMVPEHCPESQRTAVYKLVQSFIASEGVRDDGRLAVR